MKELYNMKQYELLTIFYNCSRRLTEILKPVNEVFVISFNAKTNDCFLEVFIYIILECGTLNNKLQIAVFYESASLLSCRFNKVLKESNY